MANHRLILGASSGIGYATAEHFLSQGDAVTVVARRQERLETLVERGARAVTLDVTDSDALGEAIKAAAAEVGLFDTIIFTAGMQQIKPLRMTKPADLRAMIETNLTAPLVVGGLFASKKITALDATYCLVSSIAGSRPEPGIVGYAATKAALDNAIRGMARELGPRRVVGVAPGWLNTEMTQASSNIYNEAFRERLEKDSPTGIATVEHVVACINFLVSPQARAITGEIVRVDGGIAA